jgi:hypothetical protein
MDAENIIFYHKNPFGVRLTDQEKTFLDENYDELFDGDKIIAPRKAFMLLVEKALYKVKVTNQQRPEDKEALEKLRLVNEEITGKYRQISTQFNDLVELKLNLEAKLAEALEKISKLEANPEIKEVEVTKERDLAENERLLILNPFENWLLIELEKHHNCDAKTLLIDRFFMVYQRRGNGDYAIKRLNPAIIDKVENQFKTTAQ